MNEQDLLRIVRNMLSSVVDLVDSSSHKTKIPALLRNVRDGTADFCSLLDEVIIDQSIEDITYEPDDSDEEQDEYKDEE